MAEASNLGFWLVIFLWVFPGFALELARAEADEPKLTFGGFIDTYYNYDFNRPPEVDRTLVTGVPLGTSAIRSNEININLAFIEARMASDRVRGRLALQAGTSVQANYAGESSGLGTIKGPVPAEWIQEATAGYRIAEGLWVDGGIYLSHIGFENFVSRENWTYTRSLMAEYSPYYEAGVKLSYQISPIWSAQFHILNGWQTIYNTNPAKALGLQLSYSPSGRLTFTYNNFFQGGPQTRFFNDLIGKVSLGESVELAASFDMGIQSNDDLPRRNWYAGALLVKWQLLSQLALGGRVEEYYDPHQVIVVTGTPRGFATAGASVNADVSLQRNILWRTEARALLAQDAVFTSEGGPLPCDRFLVTSLSLSF